MAAAAAHVALSNIDYFRPRVESAILNATGLRISLGHMELQYFPAPRLLLSTAQLNDNDGFEIRVDDASMVVNFRELARGKIDITSIRARHIELHLTEGVDAWEKKYDEIVGNFQASEDAAESRFKLEAIREITLDRFEAYAPEFDEALFSIKIRMKDVASDDIGVEIEGSLPAFGETASIHVELSIGLAAEGNVDSIDAVCSATKIDVSHIMSEDFIGDAVVSFTAVTSSPGLENFALGIRADVDMPADPILSGVATGEILYSEGKGLELSSVEYVSNGLSAHFGARRDPSGDITIVVPEVLLNAEGLSALVTRLTEEGIHLAPLQDAFLSVTSLTVRIDEAGTTQIEKGLLESSGIEIILHDGQMLVPVEVEAAFQDGTLHLRELSVGDAQITGWIRPDLEIESIDFELSGEANLDDGILEAFLGSDSVRNMVGHIELGRASGTYHREEGFSKNSRFEGSISEGGFELSSGDPIASFEKIEVELVVADQSLEADIQAASPEIGNLGFHGTLNLNDFVLKGTLRADIPSVLDHMLGSQDMQRYASVIGQFREATLDLDIALPYEERGGLSVKALRQKFPPFEASVEWREDDEGELQIGDISVVARIRVDNIDSELAGPFYGKGEALIRLERVADAQSFDLLIDLVDASLRYGERVEKRPGHPLSISIAGRTSGDEWFAESMRITCLDEKLTFRFQDGGLVATEARLRLANLAQLLPDDAHASGEISIDLDTGRDYVSVSFDRAGFRFPDGVGIDSINGVLVILGDSVQFNDIDLHYRAGSCTINATSLDGHWNGSIRGEYLDLNTMIAAFQEARLRRHRDADEKKAPLEIAERRGSSVQNVSPMRGEIVVDLDRLLFRRATFSDVHARFMGEEKSIQIRDISLVPGQGMITGTVDIAFDDDNTWEVGLDFLEIDNRLLDDLLFEEARDFSGVASGNLRFESKLADLQDMLASGNGHCEWTINDGSFGKLGWATRLLKVLKTTEIFSLRLPTLRDDGLTFDQCTGMITIEDGMLQLKNAVIQSPSYRMSANGTIDFPQEKTDIGIFVHLLEPIGKITRKIPGIRQVAAVTTDRVGVPIRVSGNPYDLDFKIGSGDNTVSTTIKKVGDIPKSVSDGLFNVLKNVVKVLP